MNRKKTTFIIAVICFTILSTIAIQLFWNYENYKTNELLLYNEVQNNFEQAIEKYYQEENKKRTVSIFDLKNDSLGSLDRLMDFTKIGKHLSELDSTSLELPDFEINKKIEDSLEIKVIQGIPTKRDRENLKDVKSSFSITISNDSIDLEAISKPFDKALSIKKIKTSYQIEHFKKDSIFSNYGNYLSDNKTLEIESNSELIPTGETLKLKFKNPVNSIFKRGLIGILLSLLLASSIIFSLLYLLKIIKKQKELSEIKNDLINNITHEFKTPITTVLAAIEGVENFKGENHEEKTNKYLQISKEQLNRLNLMVEKLLETATINSENLELKKVPTNIAKLISKMANSAKNNNTRKEINYYSSLEKEYYDVDEFHFENAIHNLIENAIKYGGNTIDIKLTKLDDSLICSVSDNGKGISENHQDKIFDKFYRIPSGNKHDIKGFGIGLYYSHNIISKHGGKLELISSKNSNEFRVSL